MAMDYESATTVALYLGVSTGTLHNWCSKPPEGFKEPDCVLRGPKKQVVARGWFPEGLPEMRQWMENRLGLEDQVDKDAHWALVNEHMRRAREGKKGSKGARVPDGQSAIGMEHFTTDGGA